MWSNFDTKYDGGVEVELIKLLVNSKLTSDRGSKLISTPQYIICYDGCFSEILSDLRCEAEKEVMILEGGQTLQGEGSWLPGPSAVHCFLLLIMMFRY